MGKIMIRCPITGRAIPTGMEADEARFNSMPVFFAQAYCPFCRTTHRWFARHAWVSESAHERSPAMRAEPVRAVDLARPWHM